MIKLALGVLLWSFTHLIPALFAGTRKKLIGRFGENAYKGIFLLLMVLALYLVISGWKAAVPETVYLPPAWGRYVTALLMLAGFILFFAPYPPNNTSACCAIRQLTGVVLWGAGHLLANGEARSILLFGGFAAWVVVEMLLIKARITPLQAADSKGREYSEADGQVFTVRVGRYVEMGREVHPGLRLFRIPRWTLVLGRRHHSGGPPVDTGASRTR